MNYHIQLIYLRWSHTFDLKFSRCQTVWSQIHMISLWYSVCNSGSTVCDSRSMWFHAIPHSHDLKRILCICHRSMRSQLCTLQNSYDTLNPKSTWPHDLHDPRAAWSWFYMVLKNLNQIHLIPDPHDARSTWSWLRTIQDPYDPRSTWWEIYMIPAPHDTRSIWSQVREITDPHDHAILKSPIS